MPKPTTTTTNPPNFLLGAGTLAAAATFGGLSRTASAAQAPGGRKQISVAGKNVKVIDIHGHLVIPKSGELLQGTNVKGDYPMAQIMGPARFERMDARG